MKHQLFSLCALMLSLLVASPTANGQNIKQYGGKSKVSYLLMKGGTVWSTGSNVFFGLGQGIEDESANVYGYKRLELPKGFKAERIYRGYSFVFLVSKEGKYAVSYTHLTTAGSPIRGSSTARGRFPSHRS